MAPKIGAIQKKHGYTKEALVKILDKCIPLYKRSKGISFHTVLSKHCTYSRTHWEHWLNVKKDPEINDRFNILRDIQEQKTIEGGMNGTFNPAFSMFLLKTKHGYLEKQHADRLALDLKRLDLDKDLSSKVSSISINVLPVSNDKK